MTTINTSISKTSRIRKSVIPLNFIAIIAISSIFIMSICGLSVAVEGAAAVEGANAESFAIVAYPTYSNIYVDGYPYIAEAYNIENYNYFTLRGLAAAVNVAVIYDEYGDTIIIDTSMPYEEPEGKAPAGNGGETLASNGGEDPASNGGEAPAGGVTGMPTDGAGAKPENSSSARQDLDTSAVQYDDAAQLDGAAQYDDVAQYDGAAQAFRTTSAVLVDGVAVDIEAFNIGGYNYFKLRDFLSAVNIGVWYDAISDTILIETGMDYNPVYYGPDGADSKEDAASDSASGITIEAGGLPLGQAIQPGRDENDESGAIVSERRMREYRDKVVELVNAERAAIGVNPLTADEKLFEIAQFRCDDMAENNYFSHISPDYGDIQSVFERFGVDYYVIGENIGIGHTTPEMVVRAWMESPGHKANILDYEYEYIGVGFAYNDDGYPLWAQTFLGKTFPNTR